jgi:O-acetylhomoserine/O-acetylserine sulfhydrylase-like pyridoxal-dependent enzyme
VVQSSSKTLTSSGFGICGAVIARKGLVTNVPIDALREDFALYIKYLPNRDYGPNLHPLQAVMTLNDVRTLRSKMDLMSRSTMKVAEWPSGTPWSRALRPRPAEPPPHELASIPWTPRRRPVPEPVNRYYPMSFCVKGGVEKTRQVFDGLPHDSRHRSGRSERGHIPAISTHLQQGEQPQAGGHPAEPDPISASAEHPTTSSRTSTNPSAQKTCVCWSRPLVRG